MSTRDTVTRLVENRGESTEVRSLLEAGIDDEIGDYDFDRGLSTHLAAVGPVPGGGGSAAPTGAGPGAQSAAGGMSAKAVALAIGLPVASLSAIAAVVLMRTAAPVTHDAAHGPAITERSVIAETPAAVGASDTPAPERAGAGVSAGTPQLAVRPSNDAPRTSPAASQGRNTGAPVTQHSVTTSAGSHVEPAGETGDSHSGIVRNFPDEAPPTTPFTTPSAAASAVRPATSEAAAEAREAEDARAREKLVREEARRSAENQLQREMEELMRAKRALSSDPKLALELAERGQREYKQSLLREEREHVLLLALIGVGRVSEAERRAQPYLTNHPDSPFARRVRAALDAAKTSKKR